MRLCKFPQVVKEAPENTHPKQHIARSCNIPLIIMDPEFSIKAILHKFLWVVGRQYEEK